MTTRIGLLSILDFNLYRSRLELMRILQRRGAAVFAITPEGDYSGLLRAESFTFVPFPLNRTTFSPLKVRRQVRQLAVLFRELELDAVHTFTLRANAYGSLAARRAGVSTIVNTVSGLGSLYSIDAGIRAAVLRQGIDWISRIALRGSQRVIFQNHDDMSYYIDRKICTPSQATLILSSGVDTAAFSRLRVKQGEIQSIRDRWGITTETPVVTMVARLVAQKGVYEFINLARALAEQAQFILVGSADPGNPDAIDPSIVESASRDGTLIAPGRQDNIPVWMALSDIYVYPSYYREGVPRTVLEAMAMELPIVTTDSPGCREPVLDGDNGFLFTPRDSANLRRHVEELLVDEDLRQRMGRRSREIALARFSAPAVLRQYLDLYAQLGLSEGSAESRP